ncbi:hypothetical protein ACQWG0_25700, partial [Salmonella enterica subsp. enterica serovar Infantis]
LQMRDSLLALFCQPVAQYSSFDETLSCIIGFADQNYSISASLYGI